MPNHSEEQIAEAIRTDVLAFGYLQTGQRQLAHERALRLLNGTTATGRQPFPSEYDSRFDKTPPSAAAAGAGASASSDLSADLSYEEIAREVVTDLAEYLDSAIDITSTTVRDWMNENYPDDRNPEWPGRVD